MEFSRKYHEEAFPDRYAEKHRESITRRLNDRREQSLLRRSLQDVAAHHDLIPGYSHWRFYVLDRMATAGEQRTAAA